MSDYAEVVALVEGPTERLFIAELLGPHLAVHGVGIQPIVISKPGQKGGDVRFARVRRDVETHLKQRHDTYVTLFIDFYGIRKDWPGLEGARQQATPAAKAQWLNRETQAQIETLFGDHQAKRRFIPFVAMHEFEALLFSDSETLAQHLRVSRATIEKILADCGEPEAIDDSPVTAPSKRLEGLSDRFKKTSTGIAIAKAIGLPRIRERCPIFGSWLATIEGLGRAACHGG